MESKKKERHRNNQREIHEVYYVVSCHLVDDARSPD